MIVNEEGIDALTLRAATRRAGVSHGAPLPVDNRVRCLVAIGLGYLDYSMIHPAHYAVASRDELLDTSDVALISAR